MSETLQTAGWSILGLVVVSVILVGVTIFLAWLVKRIEHGKGEIEEMPSGPGAPPSLHEERRKRAVIAAAAIATSSPPERKL